MCTGSTSGAKAALVHDSQTRATELANHLSSAFLWSTTAQGDKYWRDVVKNLQTLGTPFKPNPILSIPSAVATPPAKTPAVSGPRGVYKGMPVTAAQHQALKDAAKAIIGSFTWSSTGEGHDYWNDVRSRLLDLGTAIKITPSLPEPTKPKRKHTKKVTA